MSYKIFYWENVLCNWACGIILCVAKTKEEAYELIRKELLLSEVDLDDENLTVFEINEPRIFYEWGSA